MEADVRNNLPKSAESVWLLMGKEYRISRSIRLQWFFQHLNTAVTPKSDEEIVNSCEELEVLSVLPTLTSSMEGSQLLITPNTRLSFVGREYRFVFCIDMSPSLATVDTETGNVLFDDMFADLRNALTGLVQPFCIPGSSLVLSPRLHITILAHTSIQVKECQVLVQGYCVDEGNIKYFLCQLKRKLAVLENAVAEEIAKRNSDMSSGVKGGMKKTETNLFFMIRDGLVALQLLPDGASAGIIVVTDGVFLLENAVIGDALLQQVRHLAAVCSFLQVGTGYRRASVEFGYVPHCALMQFIATATSGAYLASCPLALPIEEYEMNMYHKSLFCWNFQRDIDRDKIDSYQDSSDNSTHLLTWADSMCLTPSQRDVSLSLPPQPQQTTRYNQLDLQTRLSSVIALRSREGYIADGVRITKDNTQVEVKLVLPWKEHVTIEYIAKAAWPFDSSSYMTQILVNVSGPYEFLVDITRTKPMNHKPLRKSVLQKFDQTMKNLDFSDQLLVQLQLFPDHPAASKIPETITKGSPLFCFSPSSNAPILALQYGSKAKKSSKSPEAQFASYWRHVVCMDTRTWSKWFHCHRISMLPEHDRPITKDLFIPTSTGHYPPLHCRASMSAFNHLLKEWCSFILLENHSYVKFISNSPEERPYTFCLLRLIFKGHCIGLRLAFLGGTPGKKRSQITEDFKMQLTKLMAPIHKVNVKDDSAVESSSKYNSRESLCVIFLTKLFERILVKYDSIPDEIRCGVSELQETKIVDEKLNLSTRASQPAPRSVLSQYLFNQRWVWSMGPTENAMLEEKDIAQMLEAIMKQRLHEGFHFCSSNKGIISLVKEVQVVVDSSEDNMSNCSVIQYVIFPPHNQLIRKITPNDDSVESDRIQEVEGNLQMVIEVWVEPQVGTMDVQNSPLDYIHGIEYNKVPEKMFEVDAQIVTEISSYILIHKSCVVKSIINDFPDKDTVWPTIPTNIFNSSSIIDIPFLFQILPLLYKSRLVLSMYPLMKSISQDNLPADTTDQNDVLLMYLSGTLERMNDHKLILRPNENKQICDFIKERCVQNNMRIWNGDTNAPVFKQHVEDVEINLQCYLKSFGSHLIIMFTPVSVKDLSLLLEQPKDEMLTDRSVSVNSDQPSSPTLVGRRHLPFFIFECEYQMVKNIPQTYACYDQDILQDYTQALSESALTPRHINQKLPEDRSREIAIFCQALYDHYFWALVSGVYSCLLGGYILDPDDVELSIELVCEESIQEIDITNFIQTICSHYRTNTYSMDVFVSEDVFDSIHVPLNKSLSRLKKRSSSGSSSILSSKTSLKSKTKECDNIALHDEIKALFMEILEQYFQPVPNDPYFMFFSNTLNENVEDVHSDDQVETSSARSSISHSTDLEETESISTPCTESDNQTDELESLPADALEASEVNDDQRPLFLHLTCSCHYKSQVGNTIRPISVTTLPTCLVDILTKLDDFGRDIDCSSKAFSVTLDLICLTQPSEPEEGSEWKTPKEIVLQRRDSCDSYYSAQSQDSERQRRQRLLSQLSQDESYAQHDLADTLDILPVPQRLAMEKTMTEINWLLEDEIASALRTQGPVTEKNLDKVSQHVQSSKGFENCIFERRYFMFVTGIEKASDHCLPLFICELESARLGRYELSRVGKYYCVVLNPNRDDESDTESAVMDDVKERGKTKRKGLGHRRSQSDFTANRQHTIDRIELNESMVQASRSHSLPSVYLTSEMFNIDMSSQSTDNIFSKDRLNHTTHMWQSASDINPVTSSSIDRKSSSKGDSSASLNPEDEGFFIRRCMSYTEKDIDEQLKITRRSFSLPNLHLSGDHDEEEDNNDYDSVDSDMLDIVSTKQNTKNQLISEALDFEEESNLHPHPDFWLFTHISEESVDVYLHRRRAETLRNMEHHKSIYDRLLDVMDQICKIVNQRILLENLYNTNQCHSLLIADDEERLWDTSENAGSEIVFVKGRENTNTPFGSVVHGEYKFQPGYFECELVWQKNIPIHSRLTTTTTMGGASRGLLAVKSVLIQFQVANRQNLFVIRENTNNVFYFRVNEGSHNRQNSAVSPFPDDEHLFTPVREDLNHQSRASSLSSLIMKQEEYQAFNRFDLERQESYQSGQYMSKNDDRISASEVSLHNQGMQDYVNLSFYGIRDPGSEIRTELMQIVMKKLDVTTLDLINQSLARNPKCKLMPQDVEFIQPIGHQPARIIRLCVSNYAVRYLHAAMFYLHQQLLEKYNTPRYTVAEADFHFKDFSASKPSSLTAEPICSNDLYLYNRRETTGNGIGIVYVTLVDQSNNKVLAQPYYPTINYESFTTEEFNAIFNQISELKKFEDLNEDDSGMCRNILIQFKIWERGNIEMDNFEKDLLNCVKHALCDVFLEYHLFCTPLCHIPKPLQSSVHSSRRESIVRRSSFTHLRQSVHSSGSSAATTPKLIKPHANLKKFFSEPTTPNDMRSESPGLKIKDDLSLVAESPKSLPRDYNTAVEISPEEIEKRRYSLMEQRRQSPVVAKKKMSREDSPLMRKRSASSLTPSNHSDDGQSELNKQQKTISMSELNQLKLPVTSYVMLTDAEVHESFKAVTAETDSEKKLSTTWQEIEIQRRLELDNRKERRKHEHGIKGELHANYHECAPTIFDNLIKEGAQSMHKQVGYLTQQYPLELVMKEFVKEMNDKSGDIVPKVYKYVNRCVDGTNVPAYPRFQERSAVKPEESGESSMDSLTKTHPSLIPKQVNKFVVVGHNSHKWLLSMGTNEAELSDGEEGKSMLEDQCKQKFRPLQLPNPGSSHERRRFQDVQPPSCISHTFVPRQKFFMAVFEQKKITFYTYNYTSDVTAALDKQLQRLYAWHNVRSHLHACLLTQKFGLFHHKHFVRDCPGKNDPDVASFAVSASRNYLVPLMKEVSPKAKEKSKQENDYQPPPGVKVPAFDEAFRGICPTRTLQQAQYFSLSDLVKRQAYQYQDVKNIKLHIAHQEARLKEIFDGWKQEGAHVPVYEERLHLLKKHSRFLHYCNAPVMFKIGDEKDDDSDDILKAEEVKEAGNSSDESDSSQIKSKGDWYEELKWTLVQQYIQYLQTLGLCLVQIVNKNAVRPQPTSRGRNRSFRVHRTSNRSSDGKDARDLVAPEVRPAVYYLQKTSIGGIILMEVFFRKDYICIKLLAFDTDSLRDSGGLVSAKDRRHFGEDCNKFKDLTHLRSFTYDFHIRQIQYHLSGRHSVFQKGYPVHRLMEIIMQEYPKSPKFCTCVLSDGVVSLPCTPGLLPRTVFKYLISNSSTYKLSKICVSMETREDLDLVDPNDYVLTFNYNTEKQPIQFPEGWRTRRDATEYDGNVAVYFVASENNDVITLPFFLILGSKKEFYPRPYMLSSVSALKRRERTQSGMEIAPHEGEYAKQKVRVRFSGPSESQESITVSQVQSTGNLKRLPSWSLGLSEACHSGGSLSSIRSSESDTCLQGVAIRNSNFSSRSPGKHPFNVSPDLHVSGSPDSDIVVSDMITRRTTSTTSTQENFLTNEMKFLNFEICGVRDQLNSKVGLCLSNCWRDLIWLELLTFDDDEQAQKKKSRMTLGPGMGVFSFTKCIDDWKVEKSMHLLPSLSSSNINFAQLKLLLGLVTCVAVSEIDDRISDVYAFIKPGTQHHVVKALMLKFGALCRQFISDDGDSTYLCILNPYHLDMFFLVETNDTMCRMEFSVVFRSLPRKSQTPFAECLEENLKLHQKHTRSHVEFVLSCLCFCLWQQMLPS